MGKCSFFNISLFVALPLVAAAARVGEKDGERLTPAEAKTLKNCAAQNPRLEKLDFMLCVLFLLNRSVAVGARRGPFSSFTFKSVLISSEDKPDLCSHVENMGV